MKLYLAYKDSETLLGGTYQHVIGVFDTKEGAWEALSKTYGFEISNINSNGELPHYCYVEEVELNESLEG